MRSLWRISNRCDLEGLGGERADGRWHTAARGRRIVYLSEHPAVSLIEVLANLNGDPKLFPDRYQLMKVAVPDSIFIAPLPENAMAETQSTGNAWLSGRASALMGVPSLPAPESTNYLLNPLHPDARQLTIQWCKWLSYDKRLFHVHSTV